MQICSYLLLICIYMECFGFKLEFGDLVPEFDTDRQTMKQGTQWMDKDGEYLVSIMFRQQMLKDVNLQV